LQDQKEIKKVLDLPYKKDKVLGSFCKMDGLILLDIFIQNKLNIPGGV
jgi:hypothetical protein